MGNNKIWNRFLVNFANGVVLLLPIAVTVGLIRFLFVQLNSLVLDPILQGISPFTGQMTGTQKVYFAKALIFVSVIITVAVIGWAAKILIVRRSFGFMERVLLKVPVMGRVYNAAKQLFTAFLGQGKTIFKQVVLVEYPRKGLFSVGFTTGTTKGEIRQNIKGGGVNVFIPTTPNPTSGVFLVVPKDSIHFLQMSVEDGMKLVVSGGSVTPPVTVKDADGSFADGAPGKT